MHLFDYYLKYMTEVYENKRQFPTSIELNENDQEKRLSQLSDALKSLGMKEFVRLCAEQEGLVIPDEVFEQDEMDLSQIMNPTVPLKEENNDNTPSEDPDKGKHVFEVFLDCINQDENLVEYLIKTLKENDRKEFYKLSMITTKMDLDPDEFLYWLGNKENYSSVEEHDCAIIMDNALERIYSEKKLELLAALLSGDKNTFEIFRCESPELKHLPIATFDWYCKNYIDRDYPIRFLMKIKGVQFPSTKE